jgi:hypothetical protein
MKQLPVWLAFISSMLDVHTVIRGQLDLLFRIKAKLIKGVFFSLCVKNWFSLVRRIRDDRRVVSRQDQKRMYL